MSRNSLKQLALGVARLLLSQVGMRRVLIAAALLAGCVPSRSSLFGPVERDVSNRIGIGVSWTEDSRTTSGSGIDALLAEPLDLDAALRISLARNRLRHQFAPGLDVEAWGHNGSIPGPLIEAVVGDRVRIYVTNKLPEPTTVHWHGVLLPNGDGLGGLTQTKTQGDV